MTIKPLYQVSDEEFEKFTDLNTKTLFSSEEDDNFDLLERTPWREMVIGTALGCKTLNVAYEEAIKLGIMYGYQLAQSVAEAKT